MEAGREQMGKRQGMDGLVSGRGGIGAANIQPPFPSPILWHGSMQNCTSNVPVVGPHMPWKLEEMWSAPSTVGCNGHLFGTTKMEDVR